MFSDSVVQWQNSSLAKAGYLVRLFPILFGEVAPTVERWAEDPSVAGSIPVLTTAVFLWTPPQVVLFDLSIQVGTETSCMVR